MSLRIVVLLCGIACGWRDTTSEGEQKYIAVASSSDWEKKYIDFGVQCEKKEDMTIVQAEGDSCPSVKPGFGSVTAIYAMIAANAISKCMLMKCSELQTATWAGLPDDLLPANSESWDEQAKEAWVQVHTVDGVLLMRPPQPKLTWDTFKASERKYQPQSQIRNKDLEKHHFYPCQWSGKGNLALTGCKKRNFNRIQKLGVENTLCTRDTCKHRALQKPDKDEEFTALLWMKMQGDEGMCRVLICEDHEMDTRSSEATQVMLRSQGITEIQLCVNP